MPKIVRFHETGGPEVLKLEEVPLQEPGPDEVRIKVEALGLNRAEVMFHYGQYVPIQSFPSRIGYEAAGVVDAVGAKVKGIKVGDRVSTIPAFDVGVHGVYGESATVPAHAVAGYPGNLDATAAAAIWMQYLTAWGGLVRIAGIQAGDPVIITAASSSVGIAAIQICNLVGAIPVATTRTSAKKQDLLDLGAAHVIATGEEDLAEKVMDITGGRGAALAFDPIAGPMLETLAGAVRPGGMIIVYGSLHQGPTHLPILPLAMKGITVRPYVLFQFTMDPEALAAGKQFVFEGLESGKLKPVIDRVFTLDQIVDAHRHMESNTQLGKIVVKV
jgi:NADPH:quinone reductase-like Zn-dependent oxidoreductase